MKASAFAGVYTVVSLATEIVLIAVLGLRVPGDNARIAPILLTIPPVLAALVCGYRRPKAFLLVVILTVVLTVMITLAANRVTGISTGLVEPIVTRSLAGLLAGAITNRVSRRI